MQRRRCCCRTQCCSNKESVLQIRLILLTHRLSDQCNSVVVPAAAQCWSNKESALHTAARHNRAGMLLLLHAHSDPGLLESCDSDGNTPLLLAAGAHNPADAVSMLVSWGAALDVQNEEGNSPLHRWVWMAAMNHYPVCSAS